MFHSLFLLIGFTPFLVNYDFELINIFIFMHEAQDVHHLALHSAKFTGVLSGNSNKNKNGFIF